MIAMDAKTQLKIDIITKASQGKILARDASKLLGKSMRTIERYLSAYCKEGILFAKHKNTGCSPGNKTSAKTRAHIEKLIKNKYYDFNLAHLQENLLANEGISIKRETLRKVAHDIHHVKRAKRRRGIIRKRRERMTSPGLLLQLDGSHHQWFGNKKSCLMAIIDDSNSELHAEFFESETTAACMKLLRNVIAKRGIFKTLYVDRAGIYGGPKRCHFSQVQRACEEVGIEILYAHSAEAKGRIERSFDTLQDRLIPELRLQGINDMDGANKYLKKKFIPRYWNKQITVVPRFVESEYMPVPNHIKLREVFIQKEYRKIRNDHAFSFRNTLYSIESKIRNSIAKQEIEIRIFSDGKFKVFFAGRRLRVKEVTTPRKGVLSIPLKRHGLSKNEKIQRALSIVELADKLGNVSKAAKLSKVSRVTVYRYKKLLQAKGPTGIYSTGRHKNMISEKGEKKVVAFSLDNPHLGQDQVAIHLEKQLGRNISGGRVRYIWLRYGIQTMKLRLERREKIAA